MSEMETVDSINKQSLSPSIPQANRAIADEIMASKKMSFKGKFKDAYEILKALESLDDSVDEKIAKLRNKYKLPTITLIASIVLGFILGGFLQLPHVAIVFAATFVLSIIYMIILKIRISIVSRSDLSNGFKDTLIPVLELLMDDINPKTKVRFDLDFTSESLKSKVINKEKLPPGRNRKLFKTTFFNPWCNIDIPLANNSAIRLSLTSYLFAFDRYYRSSSGKSKHKRKWKALVEASAFLFPDNNNLTIDTQAVNKIAQSSKIKPGQKGDIGFIKTVRKFKFKSNTPNQIPDHSVKVDDILEMLITLCKSTAKAKGE